MHFSSTFVEIIISEGSPPLKNYTLYEQYFLVDSFGINTKEYHHELSVVCRH